ncbi:nucleoside-diphosphate sugar epimerase [Natrinema mahii]|nr:nucleoside-diphosphate sugar epimerase [Natrinema mahii]
MLNDELGTDSEPEYVATPVPEDVYVHETCADASKMHETMGWEPDIALETGLERVCEPD